jgi:hypothetical protein
MPEDTSDQRPDGEARMELDPEAVHQQSDGYYLDCPECGSPVSLVQIIEVGRCTGSLDADETEVEGDDTELQDPQCTAALSLELVWES